MLKTRRPEKFLILSEVVAYSIWLPVIMTSAREPESEEGMLRMGVNVTRTKPQVTTLSQNIFALLSDQFFLSNNKQPILWSHATSQHHQAATLTDKTLVFYVYLMYN